MKKLLFLLSLIIIISSCSLQNSGEPILENSSTKPEIATSVSDVVLDDYYLNESIKLNDTSKCNNILDSQKKKECNEILQSLSFMQEAVEQLDESKCNSISIERYQDSCKIDVKSAKTKVVEEKLEESKRLIEAEEISKILEEADQKQDLSLCDKLSDANQKEVCYYNVITKSSILERNPETCNQIQNETYKQACKDSILLNNP